MCGRMTLTRSGSEIAEYFALAMSEDGEEECLTELDGQPLRPRFNIAPSQWVPTVLRTSGGNRTFEWKQWGLIPSWSSSPTMGGPTMGGRLFNARSETAHKKPSFRSAWKRRRCLVVADGFYEWTPKNRDHQPYYFHASATSLLAFAGLYEEWRGEGGDVIESCTVLTTSANADLEGVHHRMPVILDATVFDDWLDPEAELEGLKRMMVPAAVGTLKRHPVDRAVNRPQFDQPNCVLPVSESHASQVGIPATNEGEAQTQGDLFTSQDENNHE